MAEKGLIREQNKGCLLKPVLVVWRTGIHREGKAEGTSTATADVGMREGTKGTSEQPPIPAGSQVKN